jgi:hypothetical protein
MNQIGTSRSPDICKWFQTSENLGILFPLGIVIDECV